MSRRFLENKINVISKIRWYFHELCIRFEQFYYKESKNWSNLVLCMMWRKKKVEEKEYLKYQKYLVLILWQRFWWKTQNIIFQSRETTKCKPLKLKRKTLPNSTCILFWYPKWPFVGFLSCILPSVKTLFVPKMYCKCGKKLFHRYFDDLQQAHQSTSAWNSLFVKTFFRKQNKYYLKKQMCSSWIVHPVGAILL